MPKLKVVIFKKNNNICGFSVENHTEPIVCAAVSVLAQSAVNAVEALTEVGDKYELEINEENGYLYFFVPSLANGEENPKADLLLKAFELSIRSVEEEYFEYMTVKTQEVSNDDKN